MASSTPDWSALASQNEKLVIRPGAELVGAARIGAESADSGPAAPHPTAQARRGVAATAAAILGGLGGGPGALQYRS
jgi:hypothetical protein